MDHTEEDVRQLALRYQELGPDMFPFGYYLHLARRYFEEPHIVRGEN